MAISVRQVKSTPDVSGISEVLGGYSLIQFTMRENNIMKITEINNEYVLLEVCMQVIS